MFEDVARVKNLLQGLPCPYWIAGGWAVDLFLRRQTREHKDIEVAIARDNQACVLKLNRLRQTQFAENRVLKPWRGEPLSLPVHEIRLEFNDGQKLEVLLNEFNVTHWLYRRNQRIVRKKSYFEQDCLPIEVVLLFKSTHMRQKDQADFLAAVPLMNADQKSWLKQSLSAEDGAHPWLNAL